MVILAVVVVAAVVVVCGAAALPGPAEDVPLRSRFVGGGARDTVEDEGRFTCVELSLDRDADLAELGMVLVLDNVQAFVENLLLLLCKRIGVVRYIVIDAVQCGREKVVLVDLGINCFCRYSGEGKGKGKSSVEVHCGYLLLG